MKLQMTSVVYDGLAVTLEGDEYSIANWLHENIYAGIAALEVGSISDQGDILWSHNDSSQVESLKRALKERRPIETYNIQDCNIGDDKFKQID